MHPVITQRLAEARISDLLEEARRARVVREARKGRKAHTHAQKTLTQCPPHLINEDEPSWPTRTPSEATASRR